MNKNAIKKFAIEARKKLIDSVTDKAGMLGITEKSCSEPITKGSDFEVYRTVAGTEVTLNKRQCEQRRRLVSQIESRGFEAVVEEVAYTWFNRIERLSPKQSSCTFFRKRREDGAGSCDTGTGCGFRPDCTGKRRNYQLENEWYIRRYG